MNVQTKGDVTILGKKGLKTVEFTTFFPDQTYPFAAYPKKTGPYWYVRKLESWSTKAVRLTITDTNINMLTTIQTFTYGEPDSTGDIEYTLSLKEYRPPTYTKPKKKPKTNPELKPIIEPTVILRPPKEDKSKPKTYTVKKGDNLWNLAKKYYGSGSKMSKLYKANESVIEKTAKKHGYTSSSNKGVAGWWIFPGTKLVIPK